MALHIMFEVYRFPANREDSGSGLLWQQGQQWLCSLIGFGPRVTRW